MAIQSNPLINRAPLYSLDRKSTTCSSKPLYACITLIIMGLVAIILLQPTISQAFVTKLPALKPLFDAGFYVYIGAIILSSIGLIGLVIHIRSKDNKQEEDNLITLIQREQGEKLTVEDGVIKTRGIIKEILCTLIPAYRRKQNKKLKKKISSITSEIKIDEQTTKLEKKFIKKLFFETLSPLSRKVYARKLDPSVIQFLDHEISRDEETTNNGFSTEYCSRIKSAQLWARLGNFKRPEGSAGGSYIIIEGISKRKLGLFKPSDEETCAKNNPNIREQIKRICASTILYPIANIVFSTVAGQGFIAEVAAKKIEKFVVEACTQYDYDENKSVQLKEFVPETHVATMQLAQKNPRVGSFQLWVNEKYQTFSKFLNISRNYTFSAQKEKELEGKLNDELFDIMVIIDYISGNFDRHGDNWLIVDEGKQIRLIDGGWAMSPYHPSSCNIFELKNHYLWKRLPQASKPFTELGKYIIDYMIQHQDQLISDIVELYAPYTHDGQERANRMKERMRILEIAKDTMTKRELAKITTDDLISFKKI